MIAAGKTLVALLFESDRAPYVVKNAVYGSPGGGSVEREVPWREGRATFSARREHLLRLLVPVSQLPDVEVLSCRVSARSETRPSAPATEEWFFGGTLYITPIDGDLVIPFHRAKLIVAQGLDVRIGSWTSFRMFPPSRMRFRAEQIAQHVDSATVTATSSEVILSGPGKVHFDADAVFPAEQIAADAALEARLTLSVIGAELPLSLSMSLQPVTPDKHQRLAWAQRVADED